MSLRVNVEDLLASGLAVTGHGENVATAHAAADNRIESAAPGWQGSSAAAMAYLAERWQTTTSALLVRMSDHAQGLHASAGRFTEMEQRHSRALHARSGQNTE